MKCPICNQSLILRGNKGLRWNRWKCPDNNTVKLISDVGLMKYHYDVEFSDSTHKKISWERYVVEPFILNHDGESKIVSVRIFGGDKIAGNIINLPTHTVLPWNNKEKLLNKIKTYILLS